VVSNYTKTLDMLEKLCEFYGYTFGRLDGQTEKGERQRRVDRFNDKDNNQFIFLLSTKAGGVGINLIGANRLVLFDSDWNPAHDRQAMARVWRDGQNKNVCIYRLLSTGTIEEKIYQRQLTKQGLSDSIVDGKMNEKKNSFTKEELKDIFSLSLGTLSETHDLLGCTTCCTDEKSKEKIEAVKSKQGRFYPKKKTESLAINAVAKWNHYCDLLQSEDPMLQSLEESPITFIFSHQTSEQELDSSESKEEVDGEEDKEDEPENGKKEIKKKVSPKKSEEISPSKLQDTSPNWKSE